MRTEVTAEQASGVEPETVQSSSEVEEVGRSHALEATSLASGAIAGAVAGSVAGPMAAVAGGLIGSVIGAAAGIALGDEQRTKARKDSGDGTDTSFEAEEDDEPTASSDESDPDLELLIDFDETPSSPPRASS